MIRRALPITLSCLLHGCAMDTAGFDTGAAFGGAELDPGGNQLRIDVFPSSATPDLVPQTWVAPTDVDWTDLDVEVFPPVSVEATVLGYIPMPHSAEVPGAQGQPINAQVTLLRPGTINGATVETDDEGRFSVEIPPAPGYRIQIVPIDQPTIPMLIQDPQALTESVILEDIDLGSGEPVFGNVTYEDGVPGQDIEVRLQHRTTGLVGAKTRTDETGHYLLRALPGEYNIVMGGNPGTTIPTQFLPLEVEEEAVSLDVDLGVIDPVQITGQVFDAAGNARQKDIKVRMISGDLTQTVGELIVETETDGDGLFNRSILPGDWTIEFVPPFDSDLSPFSRNITVSPNTIGSVTLEPTFLPDLIRVVETVRDARGNPIRNAVINATELRFDGYTYSATADEDGEVKLNLPATDLSVMLIPPSSRAAITHTEGNPATERLDLDLVEGERLQGRVRHGNTVVPFAYVEIRDVSGVLYGSTLTDDRGEFSVRVEQLP